MNPLFHNTVRLLCVITLAAMFSACDNESVDVTSHATPKAKVVLPPKGDTYEVIGKVEGLQNFAVKYDDKIYRGGMPRQEQGMKYLSELGIRHIVSITPTDKIRIWASKYGIELTEILFEKKDGLSKAQLRQLVNVLESEKGPFYIHCHGGKHRAGTCCAAYRIHLCGWSHQKAVNEYDLLGGDPEKERILLTSIKMLGEGNHPKTSTTSSSGR